MRVLITLDKTNTGKVKIGCVRSTNERGGIGTGYALPPFNPNALSEIQEILSNLGVAHDVIKDKLATLSAVGAGELVKVEDRDVPDDVLKENGFLGM
jgi:hypothetical protein